MKTFLIMILLISCNKVTPIPSDEVLLNIINECRCRIKVYTLDGQQYLSDMFDCSYISRLSIKLKPGMYRIKAENYQGKIISKDFKKEYFAQEFAIEF